LTGSPPLVLPLRSSRYVFLSLPPSLPPFSRSSFPTSLPPSLPPSPPQELSDLDTAARSAKKLKTRLLSQIVSPAASTYLYDCCLRPDDIEYPENRPFLGLLNLPSNGFTLIEGRPPPSLPPSLLPSLPPCLPPSLPPPMMFSSLLRSTPPSLPPPSLPPSLVHVDSRTARVTEGLTEEGVKVMLSAGGVAEPVYTQSVDLDLLRSLLPGGGEVEKRELQGHKEGKTFYHAVIHSLARELEIEKLSSEMHLRVAPPLHSRPRPVSLSTALQIGLLPNPAVPDLIPHLLPQSLPLLRVHSSRFLRRWLLTPPPYHLADAMQSICRHLAFPPSSLPSSSSSSSSSSTSSSFPPSSFTSLGPPQCKPLSIGKLVSMLSLGQGNVPLFRDLLGCLEGMLVVVGEEEEGGMEGGKEGGGEGGRSAFREIIPSLRAIVAYESGMEVGEGMLRERGKAAVAAIQDVIIPCMVDDPPSVPSSFDSSEDDEGGGGGGGGGGGEGVATVPSLFFERNEEPFRNAIRPDHPSVIQAFTKVREAAAELCLAVARGKFLMFLFPFPPLLPSLPPFLFDWTIHPSVIE